MLMTDQQSSELAKPGVRSFDDPTALVAAQFAPILVAPLPIVLAVRCDQLDAAFLQSLAQRVRRIGGVGNHPFCRGRPLGRGTETSSSVASAISHVAQQPQPWHHGYQLWSRATCQSYFGTSIRNQVLVNRGHAWILCLGILRTCSQGRPQNSSQNGDQKGTHCEPLPVHKFALNDKWCL